MHIIFSVITLSGIVAFVWAIISVFPKLENAVLGNAGQTRNASLDGLRGLLALAVLVHHGIITRSFYLTGDWAPPVNNFDNLLGMGSVALFFMASSYLFGGRIIRSNGELDVRDFAVGRIRRIVPLYYVAVIVLIAISLLYQRQAADSPLAIMGQIVQWSAFGFVYREGINGFDASNVVLSAIWSLKYEWMLYFILPALALLMRRTRHPAPLFLGLMALSFYWPLFAFFVAGIVAYYLVDLGRPTISPYWRWAALVGVVTLVWTSHDATGPWEAILLLPLFIACLQGGGVLKFLKWKPLRFLGQISYSVYLLHGAVLFIISDGLIGRSVFSQLSDVPLYMAISAIGCAVVLVSTATFLLIENPMLVGNAGADRRRTLAG